MSTTTLPKQSRYDRNRPFLVINTLYRPAPGVRTERKGWGAEPKAWQVLEQRSVVDNVTPNLLQSATVIIDVLNKRVVKTQYVGNDASEVVQHYLTKYVAEVSDAMNVWLGRVMRQRAVAA